MSSTTFDPNHNFAKPVLYAIAIKQNCSVKAYSKVNSIQTWQKNNSSTTWRPEYLRKIFSPFGPCVSSHTFPSACRHTHFLLRKLLGALRQ